MLLPLLILSIPLSLSVLAAAAMLAVAFEFMSTTTNDVHAKVCSSIDNPKQSEELKVLSDVDGCDRG